MNVIDSSAWLSYFAGDKNAELFAGAIEDIENLLVPSITLTEVFKNIARLSENLALKLSISRKKEVIAPIFLKVSYLMFHPCQ